MEELTCINCSNPLEGRQKKYCSLDCSKKQGRREWIKKVYGLTLEEYDQILAFQQGACAICRKLPKPGKSLAVDHDHKNKAVRGLLCTYCNQRSVGNRSLDSILKVADYLTNPPAVQALGKQIKAPGRPKKKRKRRR